VLKRCLRILAIVGILLLNSVPVLAVTSVDVTITATPGGAGIVTFIATYISETQIDLDWTVTGDVDKVMVRAKYGSVPDDIPDEDTAPTDGYLVYYDTGLSSSDTSMDFDLNPGPLHYKAYAQKADGKWYTVSRTDWKESQIMTLIFFAVLAGILSFIGAKSSFWILKVLAGLSWWGLDFYWMSSPPSNIVKGSAVDQLMIALLIVVGLAFMLMPYWYTSSKNGQEEGKGFKMPFQKTQEEEEDYRARYSPSRKERNAHYIDRLNR
jgi:hypothetical protein